MTTNSEPMWCVSFSVPEAYLGAYELAIEPLEGAVVTSGADEQGRIPVQIYVETKPEEAFVRELLSHAAEVMEEAVPDFTVEQLPDVDWVAESQKALPPIVAGKFFVHGSHVTDAPPEGSMPLLIEANVAFGTGQHDTTKGCLIALTDLAEERKVASVLDMGCGSGILTMAARLLWDCPVLGVDIDADSVRVAIENATLNKVEGITAVCGDGYDAPEVVAGAPYDLIVANILAEPLCQMAPQLAANLADDGVAVLSGLLITQQEQVVKAHEAQGLKVVREIHLGEWATLVLSR